MATEYGLRLRAARKYAKMTQIAASKASGIPQSTISTSERESHGSSETPVYARLYGVDAHWLATGEGTMIATDGSDSVQSRFAKNQSIELANALEKVEAALVSIKTSAANNTVHLDHAWPFKNITRDQWLALTEEQRAAIETVAASMMSAHHIAGGGGQHDKRHAA